ncbi:hypothetical protein D9M68_712060 [compost metagenome]
MQLGELTNQGGRHDVRRQLAFRSQFLQRTNRLTDAVCQGLHQPGCLLGHAVELVTAQGAGAQGLSELHHAVLGLCSQSTGDTEGRGHRLGHAQNVLLALSCFLERTADPAIQVHQGTHGGASGGGDAL